MFAGVLHAADGGELRFCVRTEPKNLHPLLAIDDVSDTVRYLTSGVLIRVNRATQREEPELATEWSISRDYRSISLHIRRDVRFSDGTPLVPSDVAYTFRQVLDPKLESPIADSFRLASGGPMFDIRGDIIKITFAAPIADFVSLFDQLPILSGQSKLGRRRFLDHSSSRNTNRESNCCWSAIPIIGSMMRRGVRCPISIPSGYRYNKTAKRNLPDFGGATCS